MTKCNVLPRAMGPLPAGSAVRAKSRLALYSARGAVDAVRLRAGLAVLVEAFDLRLEVAVRPALPPVARFALFARAVGFRTVARFARDRGPDRVLAMPPDFCQEHAGG